MKLSGSDGQTLELSVLGYQFPSGPTEWHDRNWLKVLLQVAHPRGKWRSTDPSLLTSEVLELADWLDAVAAGQITQDDHEFVEPNLRFKVSRNRLRVYFELESRPGWAKAEEASLNDLWVEFSLDELDPRAAATDLRHQIERWPVRSGG